MAHIFKNGILYGTTISSEIVYSGTASGLTSSNIQAAIDEIMASKGAINGIASLDSNGLLKASQIPAYAMNNVFTTSYHTLADYIASDAQVSSMKKGDSVIIVNAAGYKEVYLLSSTVATIAANYIKLEQENTPWTSITGTPTSLAGYGIMDGVTQSVFNSTAISGISIDGKVITYTFAGGTTSTITTQDKHVNQTSSADNIEFPLLASTNTDSGEKEAVFSPTVTLNPSTGIITGTLNGVALKAKTWETARTLTLNGDSTGSVSINGDGDMTLTTSCRDVAYFGSSVSSTVGWYKVCGGTLPALTDLNLMMVVSSSGTMGTGTLYLKMIGSASSIAPSIFGFVTRNSGITPSWYGLTMSGLTWALYVYTIPSEKVMIEVVSKGTNTSKIVDMSTLGFVDNAVMEATTPSFATNAGNLTRAYTADTAVGDANGQTITSTYIKALSISGTTVTYTKGNGSTGTLTTQDANMTQTVSTTSASYPILASTVATTGTRGAVFGTGVTVNPSTSNITATTFTGTATKATADASGNTITTTYIKALSIAAKVITYTKGDGTTGTITTQDTTYSAATTSTDGLLSAADKTKLDGIASGANNYTHPTPARSNTTGTSSPTAGGTMAVVDSITSDSNGHITAVNTTTVTLPSNATTATTLQTARTIAISGGATGTATSFNGGANITIPVTSLNATLLTGTIPLSCIPASAIHTLVKVANTTARYALTTATAQLGDSVQEIDTGLIYIVIDEANLANSAGYQIYNAGNAATAAADSAGQNISTTYIKALSIAAKIITYTKGDGTTGTITTQDTTYSAGTGLTLSGTTINHSNSVTAGTTAGSSGTLAIGAAFTVPYVTYDAQGHITAVGTRTLTLPASDNTDANMTQTLSTTSASYPILASTVATTGTRGAVFGTGVTVNPNLGTITASGGFLGDLTGAATKISTTLGGVNLIPHNPNLWEQGNTDSVGVNTAITTRIRTIGYCNVTPSTVLLLTKILVGYDIYIVYYDSSKVFISNYGWITATSETVTVPSNAYYARYLIRNADNTTVVTPSILITLAKFKLELGLTASDWCLAPNDLVDGFSVQTVVNKTLTSPKIDTAILDTNGNEIIKFTPVASAVNEITVTNNATGAYPVIAATGTDTNIGLDVRSKGTYPVRLWWGSVISAEFWGVASAVNRLIFKSSATGVAPSVEATGTDTNIDITMTPKGTGSVVIPKIKGNTSISDVNGNELLIFSPTASAVNEITITNNATGQTPIIQSSGSDTDIPLNIKGKGTGVIRFFCKSVPQFIVGGVLSAVNWLYVYGSATGNGVNITADGSDTNIDINLTPKGTGSVVIPKGKVTLAADATSALEATTKQYVDVFIKTLSVVDSTIAYSTGSGDVGSLVIKDVNLYYRSTVASAGMSLNNSLFLGVTSKTFVISASGGTPNTTLHGMLECEYFDGTNFAPSGTKMPLTHQTWRPYKTTEVWERWYDHANSTFTYWTLIHGSWKLLGSNNAITSWVNICYGADVSMWSEFRLVLKQTAGASGGTVRILETQDIGGWDQFSIATNGSTPHNATFWFDSTNYAASCYMAGTRTAATILLKSASANCYAELWVK